MAKFFIDRPVFAIVIAIVTVILGAAAVPNLPVATYPEVVPPVVQITANFRGANAQDLERTVAQPIEQQLVALDGMLYFFSRSSNDGVLTVDVTFDLGTNIDTAVVQTQNRISLAAWRPPWTRARRSSSSTPRLPRSRASSDRLRKPKTS